MNTPLLGLLVIGIITVAISYGWGGRAPMIAPMMRNVVVGILAFAAVVLVLTMGLRA